MNEKNKDLGNETQTARELPDAGTGYTLDRRQYEEDLARKQREHLENIQRNREFVRPWRPCMHDQCSSCHGTGIKFDGTSCVHAISCPCPRCTPYFMSVLIFFLSVACLPLAFASPSYLS